MENYNNQGALGFLDLKQAYHIVRVIMSKSKFHDVVRKAEMQGLGTIKKRYNLEENGK
jgi:hypothetical protein